MKKVTNTAKVILAIALLGTTVLFGCTKKVSEKKILNIGTASDSPLLSPLIQIADSKGFFDDVGIEIVWQKTTRTSAAECLSIGKFDTLPSLLVVPLTEAALGGDIEYYAGTLSGGAAIMGFKEDEKILKDPNNWRGKVVGVRTTAGTELVLKYALRDNYGFDLEKDVTFKYLDGDDAMIANLRKGGKKGGIDVGVISANHVETAVALDVAYLFPEVFLQPDYVCCRQTANGTYYKANKDTLRDYLKAQIKAYKIYKTDKQEAIAALVSLTGQDESYVESYLYDEETSQGSKYNTDPNFNGTLGVYSILLNYIDTDRTLDEFFDISLYAEALKEVIKENPKEDFYKEMWAYFLQNNNKYPNFDSIYKPL